MSTPNPYTVIATVTQKHGRFTESERVLFCASGNCEYASNNPKRSSRIRGHANHVAHHVAKALVEVGLLEPEVVT